MKKSFSVAFALGVSLSACLVRGVDLPDGYVAQGYLQSDGTAWIDTGYCPNEKTRLDGVFEVKDMSGDHYLFGSSDLPAVADRALWMETFGNGSGYVGGFGYGYKGPASGNLGLVTTDYRLCSLAYEGGVFTVYNQTDDKTAVYDGSTELARVGKYQATTTFALFTRHHSDGSVRAQNPSLRIRRFTISEGGEVKRDLVPACRTADLALGMYDVQNNEFYANAAASGAFAVGIGDEQKSGYHRLAYLESTGTQFIDTGYVFKRKPRVEARIWLTSDADRDIMGTAKADPGCFVIDYRDVGPNIYYRYSSTSSKNINYGTKIQGVWTDCAWDNQVWHDESLKGSVDSWDFSANAQTFRIFKGRDTGGDPGMLRIAWVKMYDGDELVRDYIPAVVDGKIGLFDKCSSVIYENDGTGDFLCGPVVPSELGDFTFLQVTGSPAQVGDVSPSYGFNQAEPGKEYECTAPAEVTAGGIWATLCGWQLYYDGVYQQDGVGSTAVITAGPGISELRWIWNSDFFLTVTNSTGGTVIGEGGWKTGGEVVELTVVTDDEHEFICWTGDGIAAEDARKTTIAVTMDAPKTIRANFCSPHAQRLAYIGSTSAQQYINTKYVFTNKPAVAARAMMTANNDTDFLGMPLAKDGCFIIDYADGNKKLYYRYSTKDYLAGGIGYAEKGGAVQNRWIDFGWSNIVWHGSEKLYEVPDETWQGKFASNKQEFHLFHARSFGQIRYSTVKMYDGDVLVRDFIAAKIGGVAGLWDRVERKFYGNANGANPFEEGEVVAVEDGDFAVTHVVAAGEGGTVEVSDPKTPLGEKITLTATPAEGYAFAGWLGNVPPLQSAQATVTFAVTERLDVRATFAADVPHVVDPAGGGEFTSLEEAVSALSEAAGTILVKSGTYVVTNTLVISGGLVLKPETDRLGDVVIGAKGDFTAVELTNPLARLSNLVISNGYTKSSSKGGNVTLSAGVVQDCLIMGGRMAGGAAAGVYLTGGVLRDSVIRGNLTVGDQGGAVGVYAKGEGTLVENCDVSCNTNLMNYQLGFLVHSGGIKLDGGTVRNCFVTNNVNLGHGNLYVTGGGRVEDTVVADNVGGFYFDTLSGGGFVPTDGSAVFVRTTFARNSGYGVGGLYAGGTVALQDVKAYGNTAVVGDADGNMDVRGCDTTGIDFTNPDEKPVARVADVYLPADTTDLREAVRRCADNGTVHVAAGEYLISGEAIVDRPIRIVGEGAERTVFARDPSVLYTRLVNLRHTGAVLEDVTVRDGQRLAASLVNVFKGTVRQAVLSDALQECPCLIWNGGAVSGTSFTRLSGSCNFSGHGTVCSLMESGALLESCTFEKNEQANAYTAGNLVRLEGGRISRCDFRDNRLMGSSSCCVGLTGPGVVESSLFTHNDGSWYTGAGFNVIGSGWEVRNCTVVSNLSEYAGAAVYWATNGNSTVRQGSFVNCILYRNRCTKDKFPENFDVSAGNGTKGVDVTFQNCLFTTAEAAAAQGERAINSLSGDPKFRNLSKRNYRLGPGSPCRDAGFVWTGADDPAVLDLEGRRLSQFGRIDVGCHASNRNGMTVIIR